MTKSPRRNSTSTRRSLLGRALAEKAHWREVGCV